jgi:monomeric isocitrate dehydrogenase
MAQKAEEYGSHDKTFEIPAKVQNTLNYAQRLSVISKLKTTGNCTYLCNSNSFC